MPVPVLDPTFAKYIKMFEVIAVESTISQYSSTLENWCETYPNENIRITNFTRTHSIRNEPDQMNQLSMRKTNLNKQYTSSRMRKPKPPKHHTKLFLCSKKPNECTSPITGLFFGCIALAVRLRSTATYTTTNVFSWYRDDALI